MWFINEKDLNNIIKTDNAWIILIKIFKNWVWNNSNINIKIQFLTTGGKIYLLKFDLKGNKIK